MWKEKIKIQLGRCSTLQISKELKTFVKELLEEETEFYLIYSTSKDKIIGVRYKKQPSGKELKKLFNKHSALIWKHIKPLEVC